MELFEQAKAGDKNAKEKIVSENTGLVWSIARRFMGRGYDLEEIYQIGCIGLLKAIERFDEQYQVMFSTYAVPLIQGEIKRFLRDNGMIKVSRILKQNGYIIKKARDEYIDEMGQEPKLEELCERTGLSMEELVMACDANREIDSIYKTINNSEGKQMYLLDYIVNEKSVEEVSENTFNRLIIENAMNELNEQQRELIRLRYFGDKTQTEVAAILGISQVQVSRLEKKTLGQMRKIIDL